MKGRILAVCRYMLVGAAIGTIIYVLMFYVLDAPTERNLREENKELKSQYAILEKRLDRSLKVMEDIQKRDDNFYRVMMQMDPLTRNMRYAGLDNSSKTTGMASLNDAELVNSMTRSVDLLERQIYAQSLSFNQLQTEARQQKDKISHIPSVLPMLKKDFTMSAGFGYRRDPIYGTAKFHEGLDFSAPTGTPVYATADGTVEVADRKANYGNCIDIDHGYNYSSRYAHLSQMLVQPGQKVKRGELIGKVGSTGRSSGSHLHYEVRFKGEAQNPVNYNFMDMTPKEYADFTQAAENAGQVMD